MNSAIEQLQALLGTGKISTSPSVLEQHGRDENFPEVRPPLAVAYAESREDVQTALEWCRIQRIPLIPFGAGTSLEGALVPARPDVPVLSLDLSRMNQVVRIQVHCTKSSTDPRAQALYILSSLSWIYSDSMCSDWASDACASITGL